MPGGEFRVVQLYVAPQAVEVFKTFCLEYSEHISLGGDYVATLEGGAILGGVSGGTNYYDPPRGATQWLYQAYRTSFLDDVTAFEYDEADWADALQLVFWRLEGEMTSFVPYAAGMEANAEPVANYFLANQWIDNYQTSQVQVMNLWHTQVGGVTFQPPRQHFRAIRLRRLGNERGCAISGEGLQVQSQLYLGPGPRNTPPTPVPLWSFGAASVY